MGGRLDALQAGEHGGLPHLEVVDAHEHVAVAGQRAAVAVVDLPALGPVLDNEGQLEQAPVHLRVVPQQLGVHDCQDVVHRDVHLQRNATTLNPIFKTLNPKPQPCRRMRVVPQQLGVHDRQDVVHRDVHLCRHATACNDRAGDAGSRSDPNSSLIR